MIESPAAQMENPTAHDGEATIAVQAYFIVSASPGVKKTFRPVASALSLQEVAFPSAEVN